MRFFDPRRVSVSDRCDRPRVLLRLEVLEPRDVPYAASGNLWPHPGLITVSFQPDGTDLGGQTSNLAATFNAAFGSAAAWQTPILKALQTWAQQTNLNFAVVADSGAASGSGSYEEGDPGFGDIRVGGFKFSNSGLLALGYMPPNVNNYSIAGDVVFNTGQVFKVNGLDYDLYTVAVHELGHALGLNHSSTTTADMYSAYEGIQSGLDPDDVTGIRSIYGGARKPDAFDAAAANGSASTAADITSRIGGSSLTAVLTSLDVTTTSDVDYYKFVAPAGGTGALKLTVQSRGLSLLAPSVKVYNAAQTQLAGATGSGYLGSTLTTSVSVTAGQTYYVRVAGANTTAFGTGAYGMVLNFGSGASPVVTAPATQTLNGSPKNGGGGAANRTDENGVSVSLLLSAAGDTTTDLGLSGADNLLGGVNQLGSQLLELPFVDVLSINPDRVPRGPAEQMPPTPPVQFLGGVPVASGPESGANGLAPASGRLALVGDVFAAAALAGVARNEPVFAGAVRGPVPGVGENDAPTLRRGTDPAPDFLGPVPVPTSGGDHDAFDETPADRSEEPSEPTDRGEGPSEAAAACPTDLEPEADG